jgi:hypothetical protein
VFVDEAVPWRKSKASGTGDCVEWRFLGERVEVRNSGVVGGPVLEFSMPEWRAFLVGAKAGEAVPLRE